MNQLHRSMFVALLALSPLAGCECLSGIPSGSGPSTADAGKAGRDDAGFVDPFADVDGGTVGGGADAGTPTTTIGAGKFTDPVASPNAVAIGVKQDPTGFLVLDSSEVKLHYAWLANPSGNGTISKVDTTTGREVARYFAVVPLNGKGQPNGLRYDQPHSSSRTAVDLYGDVWVANRAFGIQGSVTKISNARETCIDRNADGEINTSQDKDGNGVISASEMITPTDPNDPLQYDECVLFSTPIGTAAQPVVARALAIDSGSEGNAGNIWVGLWCGMSGTPGYDPSCMSDFSKPGAFVKLSGTTGEILGINPAGDKSIVVPYKPYGAAVDNKNRIWFGTYNVTTAAAIVGANGTIIGPFSPTAYNCGSYGMTVQVTNDGKTRVWEAGIACPNVASRYDVDSNTWTKFDFTSQIAGEPFGYGRGIAVDEKGTAWMSAYYDTVGTDPKCGPNVARLIGLDTESGTVRRFSNGKAVSDFSAQRAAAGDTNVPCTGIGVGLDGSNRVWVAAGNGFAISADRTTGALLESPSLGSLYTYSDFTGFTLRTFTAPKGTYKTIFAGCPTGQTTKWQSLRYVADVPPNTQLQVFVKSATEKDRFNDSNVFRYGPAGASPVDLRAVTSPSVALPGVPNNPYLQVEVTFISNDKSSTPRLKDLSVSWACSGGLK